MVDGRETDDDDGRRTDGRTPEYWYTVSSPCESGGSGKLIRKNTQKTHANECLKNKCAVSTTLL